MGADLSELPTGTVTLLLADVGVDAPVGDPAMGGDLFGQGLIEAFDGGLHRLRLARDRIGAGKKTALSRY